MEMKNYKALQDDTGENLGDLGYGEDLQNTNLQSPDP
jgi:hypothetical protein